MVVDIDEQDKIHDEWWPQQLTFNENAQALDRFYDQPENRMIAIVDALKVVAARSKGASEDAVQAMISGFRALASK